MPTALLRYDDKSVTPQPVYGSRSRWRTMPSGVESARLLSFRKAWRVIAHDGVTVRADWRALQEGSNQKFRSEDRYRTGRQ